MAIEINNDGMNESQREFELIETALKSVVWEATEGDFQAETIFWKDLFKSYEL